MAKKDVDVLDRFTAAGDNAVGLINRVDDATAKFQPGQRRGSIVKASQGNIFEFPVFVSNSIPVDYATATTSLLEQIYAAYLQMAISINPVVDADSIKNGLQFANFKTNTNKYVEYTDTSYQHNACHNIIQEGNYEFEFNMLSIEDSDARLINEYVDHQPLSEFSHFFQEAPSPYDYAAKRDPSYWSQKIPAPALQPNKGLYDHDDLLNNATMDLDDAGNVKWITLKELADMTADKYIMDDKGNASKPLFDDWYKLMSDKHLILPSDAKIDADNLEANLNALRYNDNMARAAMAQTQQKGIPGGIDYGSDLQNQRLVNARNAQIASSPYYNRAQAISTGARTVNDIAGAVNTTANAISNVATLPDQIKQAKYKTKIDRDRVEHLDEDRALSKTEKLSKIKTSNIQYVDDGKCAKLNTMKPLLMSVTINMLNKDDSLQPINYIIGVKTHMRVIPASIFPEVARYPLKEMDKISRKIKWRAGELKFFKDLIFRIDEKKQTAADSRDPNRKWYRRLYELAHMKGDAPAAAVVQGKSIFGSFIRDKQGKGKMMHGMIPNASIIMSQADVDNVKRQTEIDLLKATTAKKFCGELFLISFIIIDTDAESIKVLLPDMNNDFDIHSLASVNKQLAQLDTAGTKTRDMFKLLS